MKIFKRSLRNRFFFSLIALILLTTTLIAIVTLYKFREESKHYQQDKLKRQVASIEANINYQIEKTSYPVDTKHIPLIFRRKIYEISHIHDTQIRLYDLDGKLLKSSRATFLNHRDSTDLSNTILTQLKNEAHNQFSYQFTGDDGKKYMSSFSYITDTHFKPLAILSLPHIENDGFMEKELQDFLIILSQVYLLLILVAIILSYLFSRYITKSLNRVSQKIHTTRLDRKNQRIELKSIPAEIEGLVKAYNSMVDELEESAGKLAASERQQAWSEMAKQVAHEIKNPLTPMRLSLQSFERNYNPKNPDNKEKIKNFSESMIQQIDTMSTIASAFSDFAKMPKTKSETLNIPEVVRMALDIFNDDHIRLTTSKKEIIGHFDRSQLIRIVTNLVKNAVHACEENENPEIHVKVSDTPTDIILKVKDNGIGISDAVKNRIFEPKFTTKSSGMGLGLGIIKQIIEAYHGSITFESIENKGTTFTVQFPKKQ